MAVCALHRCLYHGIYRGMLVKTISEQRIAKDLEGISRDLIEVLSRQLARRDWGKSRRVSVRIARVSAEMRAEHIPNKSLEYYLYISLFDAQEGWRGSTGESNTHVTHLVTTDVTLIPCDWPWDVEANAVRLWHILPVARAHSLHAESRYEEATATGLGPCKSVPTSRNKCLHSRTLLAFVVTLYTVWEDPDILNRTHLSTENITPRTESYPKYDFA
jgi:hypothetical protein